MIPLAPKTVFPTVPKRDFLSSEPNGPPIPGDEPPERAKRRDYELTPTILRPNSIVRDPSIVQS